MRAKLVSYYFSLILCLSSLTSFVVESRQFNGNSNRSSSRSSKFFHVHKQSGHSDNHDDTKGKRWAILIAGSSGWANYRHQADVCHAYQILKAGGLKDENIIVFMYDDIAFNSYNPRPGIIINKPDGPDVYEGVPKDYTGKDVNHQNFFGVILGNKTALNGGSGKVVDSGPNDHIFIYYSDHGSPGFLVLCIDPGMPSSEMISAKDLIHVLIKKYEAKSYKRMVIYVEACESGSMFEGILPRNLNIYAVTAANASENSWGTYCPDIYPSAPPEFDTCLGDVFSISWMEDCDVHNLRQETLQQQYQLVQRRTAFDEYDHSSHVMQYGSMRFKNDSLFSYLGTNPRNDNFPPYSTPHSISVKIASNVVSQRDASLLHFWHKFNRAPEGSTKRAEAHKELLGELSHRKHVDKSINQIIEILFGNKKVSEILNYVQSAGKPLVEDWNCFKMLVNTFRKYCGSTSRYEMKYGRALANMCNAGVDFMQAITTITKVCSIPLPKP